MAKKSKIDSFEWTCGNCQQLNIEKLKYSKVNCDVIDVKCKHCDLVRQLRLVELPETGLASDALGLDCDKCESRFKCLSIGNEDVFKKKLKRINDLGFCVDYEFDTSISTNPRQVCHEERTFDDIFNKGHLPIYEDDEI